MILGEPQVAVYQTAIVILTFQCEIIQIIMLRRTAIDLFIYSLNQKLLFCTCHDCLAGILVLHLLESKCLFSCFTLTIFICHTYVFVLSKFLLYDFIVVDVLLVSLRKCHGPHSKSFREHPSK